MSNTYDGINGGSVIQFHTPSDADFVRELRMVELYRRNNLPSEAQSLLNITMQAMISRDRERRARGLQYLVCRN